MKDRLVRAPVLDHSFVNSSASCVSIGFNGLAVISTK